MALTDTLIRSTKPSTAPIRLSDSNGLYLLLNPNGSRWWRFDRDFDPFFVVLRSASEQDERGAWSSPRSLRTYP